MVNIYQVPKVYTPTTRVSFQKTKTRTLKTAQAQLLLSSPKDAVVFSQNTQLTIPFHKLYMNYRKIICYKCQFLLL